MANTLLCCGRIKYFGSVPHVIPPVSPSGVHRQGRKEGHFSARFGSHKGTLACVLAPKRELQRVFWLPRGHFSECFGSKEGTLVLVLAPKMTAYHVLTSQWGSLVCFANQEGTLARFFGSQEGTLAHLLAPLVHIIGQPLFMSYTCKINCQCN